MDRRRERWSIVFTELCVHHALLYDNDDEQNDDDDDSNHDYGEGDGCSSAYVVLVRPRGSRRPHRVFLVSLS